MPELLDPSTPEDIQLCIDNPATWRITQGVPGQPARIAASFNNYRVPAERVWAELIGLREALAERTQAHSRSKNQVVAETLEYQYRVRENSPRYDKPDENHVVVTTTDRSKAFGRQAELDRIGLGTHVVKIERRQLGDWEDVPVSEWKDPAADPCGLE